MSKKIPCPNCTNKRLFDIVSAQYVEILIKCPKCRNTINLILVDNRVKATIVQ